MKKEKQRIYFSNEEKLYRLSRCEKCKNYYPHKTIFNYVSVITDDDICVNCFLKKRSKEKNLRLFFIDE